MFEPIKCVIIISKCTCMRRNACEILATVFSRKSLLYLHHLESFMSRPFHIRPTLAAFLLSLGSLSGGRTLFGKIRIGILDFTVFLIVCYDVLGLSNARKYASDIELSYAFANLFWCRSNFCHEDAGLTSSFLELYLYVGNGICRQLV